MNHLGELDTKHFKNHLIALETNGQVRSFYNSVSFCNRCGTCSQSCPTYRLTQEEPFSPRGRNQAVRLVLENKIKINKNRALLEKIAYSCTLCGLCTHACAGQIPTAQHILELRRLLGNNPLPRTLKLLLKLRQQYPSFFGKLIRFSLSLRRWGFLKIIRFSGLANLLGCAWLHHADKIMPPDFPQTRAPLDAYYREIKTPNHLIYLPSLEADYLMPALQLAVLKQLPASKNPLCWHDTPSGLFEYIFGDLRAARKQVKTLIMRHQHTGNGKLPLLTDSIDVYQFLKNAPALFEGTYWTEKARKFADHVCFVTDFLPTHKATLPLNEPVCLDHTAFFSCEGNVFQKTEKYLCEQTENFVQFTYNTSLYTAGYGFYKKGFFKKMQAQAVLQVTQADINTLVTLSGLAQLEWEYALKQAGKQISVLHAAQLK